MRSPRCQYIDENSAFRHINSSRAGKGMGKKADDLFGFFGCQGCEDFYCDPAIDPAIRDSYALMALLETQRVLYHELGLISVK